jgi:NitT/TauT family transport system substrate-binding protein
VQYKDEEKNADICVLPLTDASMYLNNGEDYALLGMVTHGNFFLVSEEERVYTLENVSSLVGKKIGVVQLAKLPGLTFRYVLEREGIEYVVQEGLEGASVTKVNLINVAPTAVKPNTGFDLFLIPEPLASVKKKTGFHDAGSLQTLYGGEKGYPQAAIVAKRSLIKNNSKFIDEFVENLSSADMWLRNAEVATILNAVNSHLEEGLAPSFSDKNLSREAILGCNVYYTSAESCKTEVNDFISALQTVNPNAAKSFADKFFQR